MYVHKIQFAFPFFVISQLCKCLTVVCSNVFDSQKEILGTALFIGATTWMTVSSLYYLVERESTDMIYCGAAPDYCPDDIDTSRCTIDKWGIADCTKADCPPTEEYPCLLYTSPSPRD